MKRNWNVLSVTAVGFVLIVLIGCDKLTSMTENKGQQQTAPVPSPAAPAASQSAPIPPQKAEPKPLSGNEIARVGEWRLTLDDFNERMAALKEVMPDIDTRDIEARKLILEELVRQQLLVEYAEESGISKDKNVVAAVDEFRRTLLVREVALRLTKSIKISDEEARAFYEERKDQIVQPTEYKVREIVVKEKVKANEILVDVLKGMDFSELAKLNSLGESAKNGGDLGYITQEPFPEMAEEILALDSGETSNVFKGPDGYYIIKLEDIRGGEPIPFDEIKEEIVSSQRLLKQQEVILNKIEEIKQRTPVEVKEELLN